MQQESFDCLGEGSCHCFQVEGGRGARERERERERAVGISIQWNWQQASKALKTYALGAGIMRWWNTKHEPNHGSFEEGHDVALALVANMYSFMHFAIGHFDVYNKLYLIGNKGGDRILYMLGLWRKYVVKVD